MEWEVNITQTDDEFWKEIQSKKFHFKREGQMKARLFIAGVFSDLSITDQMNSFFDENPNIKIEAIEYKVNQNAVDHIPFKDRECLLIYREGDE